MGILQLSQAMVLGTLAALYRAFVLPIGTSKSFPLQLAQSYQVAANKSSPLVFIAKMYLECNK